MNLFSELISAVQSDLNITGSSTLYPLATIKQALNRSYIKCSGLFPWPDTEDAKVTSTEKDAEYYDYPDNFTPDSIWKLSVGGIDYGEPISFKDFMYEKEQGVLTHRRHAWTTQWKRYFIYPIPTVDGSDDITVWGNRVVDALVEDADVTIFSYSLPQCNESVVLEAEAILKAKGDEEQQGAFRSQSAEKTLVITWNKIKANQAKYTKTQPQFIIPDFFGNRGTNEDLTGRF
jgi:hypothetical protein